MGHRLAPAPNAVPARYLSSTARAIGTSERLIRSARGRKNASPREHPRSEDLASAAKPNPAQIRVCGTVGAAPRPAALRDHARVVTMADITPPSPGVSEEQLTYLLGLGHESAGVDFKTTLDPRQKRDLVELAKDVGAMQVDGGYIVIGADDQGRPVPPGVPAANLPLFDEANLRPKLAKWLPDGFEIRTVSHTLADCTFVLIYVIPTPGGFCIFKADGQYPDGKDTKTVFRKGTSSSAMAPPASGGCKPTSAASSVGASPP